TVLPTLQTLMRARDGMTQCGSSIQAGPRRPNSPSGLASSQLNKPRFWLKSHFHRIADAIVGTREGRKISVRKIGSPTMLRLRRIATPRETPRPAGTDNEA